MKNKTSKLLATLFVLLCFALPVFVENMDTEAEEKPTYIVETISFDEAKTYFDDNDAPTCETDGYIFAGWYAEDDTVATDTTTGEDYFTGYPLVTIVGYMHENVKALFVEKSVLDVKGQIAIVDGDEDSTVANLTDTTTANLRLVTSVDSLKYQQVGFEISYTYDDATYEKTSATNYVYKQLKDVNGTDAGDEAFVQPYQIFSKRSQYFKACTVTNIPKDAFSNTDFTVRAYWTTADGAVVYGSSAGVSKSVQEGIYHTYEAAIGETYYKVLEDAVGTVAASTELATVTLVKDAEVATDMEVTGQVKITNRDGANVTLYRGDALVGANYNLFSVASGATLNIVGTTDENSIVLDGREVNGDSLVYGDTATIYIENATLRNAKNTTANNTGGAIHATSGELTVKNTSFFGNSSKYGGAIRTSATTAMIEKCTFGKDGEGNAVSSQGGAIYNQSPDLNIVDSEFVANTSSARGGAIYNNVPKNSTAVLNVKNSRFAYNVATTSGGAIYNAGGKTTLIAKNEQGDSELAVFEYNVANDSTDAMGGGAILTGNPTGVLDITGYVFRGNSAKKTGGAICARNGEVTITEAQFIENNTSGDNGHGGAVAYAYASAAEFTVTKSTFTGNYTEGSTAHGGAVYVEDSTKTVVNTDITTVNTYSDNEVKGTDAQGADVYLAK